MAYIAEGPQQQKFIEESGSSNLPTSPDVDTSQFSPLVQKGLAVLESTEQITQFFNRDSSDALQTTADTALTRFLANPDDVDTILKEEHELIMVGEKSVADGIRDMGERVRTEAPE